VALSFLISILFLCGLIKYRERVTPDFFHFITCVVEEEVHFTCIMVIWLTWKCWLSADTKEDKIKTVVRAAIELTLALAISQVTILDCLYCFMVFGLACIRQIFLDHFDLQAWIFICIYVS